MGNKVINTNPRQVGQVKISYLGDQIDSRYSDGDIEVELLELFKSKDAKKRRRQILQNNPTWEQYYHLSPYRGSIVDWYDFLEKSSVLEVGAGCGAVTEALTKKPVQVTALELTLPRSLVNAERNRERSNLRILVGNLTELTLDEKYDYIVCIGVLEYAGTFIDHEAPYAHFMESMLKRLKPGGKLLLAIENQHGLKYWAGAREDHTGGFFDGLNQYPVSKSVQTFGKVELEKLFVEAGYKNINFYYPFPDYKHARFIYSDAYYPGRNAEFPLSHLPTPVYGQSRVVLFSEALVMMSLEKNGLFPHFSNSFLVEAQL